MIFKARQEQGIRAKAIKESLNDFLNRIDQLKHSYYFLYHREPNAILINENDFNYLYAYYMAWTDLIVKERPLNMELMGMKVILVKYGEMEAFELL